MYARLILGYLKDCFGSCVSSMHVDIRRPIYIVELGAGSGKFSYYVLKKLMDLREFWPKTGIQVPFKYIMTDITEANIAFWRKHPKFKPFIEVIILQIIGVDGLLPNE